MGSLKRWLGPAKKVPLLIFIFFQGFYFLNPVNNPVARPETFRFKIRVFPLEAELYRGEARLDPAEVQGEWRTYALPPGFHLLTLRANGYFPKDLRLDLQGSVEIEERLERSVSRITLLGETPTGRWPKAVLFHPWKPFLLVTLLGGNGIQRVELPSLVRRDTIFLEKERGGRMGFVEFCLLPKRGELWVSQMHANAVHVLDLETLEPIATIPTRGVWPKVICADPEERLAYVSNWESRSVSVIDIASRRVLRVIPVSGVPRGLALSRRGYLYVCLYEPGDVEVIDLGTFSRHKTIALGPGAPRHILLDERKGVGYVSDMATGRVTKFTLTNHLPVASLWVGSNLNTLALTSDGKYLFASIRGRNNPVDYQLKGPEFGKVSVIDTDSFQIVDWIWGRNQPTGLALSPDDRFMACTDFLDDNLELYDISRLREISSPKGSP